MCLGRRMKVSEIVSDSMLQLSRRAETASLRHRMLLELSSCPPSHCLAATSVRSFSSASRKMTAVASGKSWRSTTMPPPIRIEADVRENSNFQTLSASATGRQLTQCAAETQTQGWYGDLTQANFTRPSNPESDSYGTGRKKLSARSSHEPTIFSPRKRVQVSAEGC